MPPSETVLLGDFNCVQSPQLDQLGPRTASRPESPALCSLLDGSALVTLVYYGNTPRMTISIQGTTTRTEPRRQLVG